MSQSPSTRSGSGKGHAVQSNKESSETDGSEPVVPLRATRTPAPEELRLEMGEVPAQIPNAFAPGKLPTPAQENSATAAAAKPRASKAHAIPVAAGRLASTVPTSDRAPKAPWYPPAAMLRSGTIPPIVVTEASGSTIHEVTSGVPKSPGSSATAGNLIDTARIVTTAEASISSRKSPRSATANSNKVQKATRSVARETLLSTEINDEAKTSMVDPGTKTNSQVEVQSLAECRISKEVEDYSHQVEAAFGGNNKQSLHTRGGSRAASVGSLPQFSSVQAKTDAVADKISATALVGKSEGEQRSLSDKGRKREERRGLVIAEEESATAISSEKDVSKQDQDTDLSARLIQEGCSTGVSGDTLIVNVGAGNSIEPKVPRLRKRGESKVKSQTLAEKAVGKGKRAPVVDSGQDEDTNLKRGYPNADVSEETAVVGNQRKDDKPKQENQKKDKRRQAGVTAVEQAFKFSTVSVQPAFQEMVVRRIEGVMGQEKASEHVVSKVVGQEKVVVLTSSSTIELASAIREQENGKKERSLAEVQANSNTENARPEETVNKTAQLLLGRDSEVSTSSSQTKEVNSLVQDCGRTAPAVVEDVIQGQCSQDWPLVPPRPLGRKKLPIKCAARSVGTANAVALAAKQASGATRQNTRGTKSVKKPGSEIAEKGNHPVEVPAATVPKTPVSRSRAARQLAKSLPSGKKGAPQIEVSTAEGENSRLANGVADPSAKKKTDVVGSTSINSGQQALLSPSSSWVKSPAVGQTSMTIDPEIVPSSPWNRATEPSEIPRTEVMADDRRTVSREESCGAPDRPQSEELHCTETLFSASQTNTEPNAQEKTSRGAISDKLVDTGPRYAEVPNDTECGKNSHDDLDASVVQVAVSQLDSCFSTGKSPDEGRLGGTTPSSDFPGVNDKDSRENSKEQGAPGDSVPAAASLTVGLPSRTVLTPAKVVIATLQGKPDTAGSFQTLEAGLATFTSSMENAVRLAALTTKVASTSASMNTQLSPARQNSSNPAVGMIRSTPSYRLNTTAIEGGGSQAVIVRTGTSTATAPPTSFTSLLQSTTLPPQSSAALSLAMQGTRPLQEACADQTELSRAVGTSSRDPMDTSKRTSEGLNWAAEKQGLASGSDASISTHVAAGTAFFRPPPEMAGPIKVSEAGEKEVSRLPGWMIAAISDPKGGEPGASVITESEHTLTVKGLTSSPECGEMSGSVKVRLWGRDVVVPPNEQSTPANPPLQQSPFGHRSETPSETIVTCLTSTPCLEGTPASSQSVLQVTARPAPARSGQGVADGTHQISMPVLNAPNSVGSADVVAVFGKSNNHQAENYLSRLDYNNQRTPYSANSREELRSSRASKGQTPTAQSTIPPEVIIIDDTAESPAKSGDTFSGEGLTMAFLLDCGALRYLPTTQNGRSGSQLMEVDPSKIPQRLVNHNFNILAELRKIGLVPAPKAVLPASYRHSSLSLEVPHSTPPPASRAVSDQLPPWLLAEKKRKEAQIAENLIVLDDDDEPPTGTVILGERRPLHSRASPGGGSNLSGQSITTGQLSPTPIGKSGSDTRGVDHSTAALRTTGMSMGATTVSASGRHSPATSHAGVHFRRGTSSSSLGSAPSVAQKSLSRKNDLIAGELIMTTGEDEVSVTGQESLVREKSRLQTPGGSKDHLVGQISPGPSRRQREEKEKQQQVPDLHHEKKTPKVGGGAQKSGSPTPVVGGTPSKKGSAQGISILAPTWMSGNNGWPKRGAAAQACKQAVERLKAQIMSSPARDGISQVGTGGVLDFESHMIGQAQEKSTNFGGNLTTANSSLQNISSQAAQAGFRYSSLSSRSGGDHENARSSKEAPHNGRGVGQSPTPVAFSSSTSSPFPSATTPVSFTTSTQGPFMSSVAAAERDVCTVSKLTTVPSVETSGIRVNHASHSTAGVQGSEANKGRSSNQGAKSSDPSATNVGDGNLSNLVVSSTPAREPSSSEQSSPTFSHIGRSGSSSPTVRSRGLGGTKTAIEASSSLLARGAMQSEQSSMLTAQGTPFSRLPPSRLSLPVTGTSMSISSTKALLEQVCFTTKAATDTFTREVSNMHEVIEQPIGGMASPQKRIQPSRRKSTTPVNGGEKSTSSPISAGSPPIPATFSATDITSSSNALNRSTPGFPSCGSSSITDQHRQMEGGMISAATLRDRATVLGAGASRITTNDLPLSPLFGRTSQTSSPSPSSSQGRYTPNNTGINSCDGGTWKLTSQTDEDDQDSVTILTERSPGSGIIPGYRLPPHIARAMGGHTQRSRPTTPTTPVTNGGFFGHRGNARLEHPFKQKDSDSSPRSKDSECPAHERYSQTRSTREEKMKDAQRESPKSTSTETAEKVRNLNPAFIISRT
ncbi:hypothetical protein AXG93_1175s1300 [Marchantia polymorpha subsp. ruderalis]|uniref:Uncharacterized protein n=1 Tax=Marchantia polymorpha subsp. ruderalis TaxID=1480154 RepID=A0A176VMM8_MARPO|nr:hypothetical protein AXG93_1175s1300 [Marchantia polymorpha subsp. ruderalis]